MLEWRQYGEKCSEGYENNRLLFRIEYYKGVWTLVRYTPFASGDFWAGEVQVNSMQHGKDVAASING